MSSLRPFAVRVGWAGFFCLALLAGCANFGERLAPPKATVTSVRLDRVDGAASVFVIGVELTNPNARDLDIQSLDANVAIEDESVATASLVSPVRLPANGTANAALEARAGMDALIRAAAAAMRRGGSGIARAPILRYSIDGNAVFNGGLRVPFRKTGELGGRSESARP